MQLAGDDAFQNEPRRVVKQMMDVQEEKLLGNARKLGLVPMHLIPEADGMVLQSARSTLRIKGATAGVLLGKLFPLLDGRLSARDIVDACATELEESACLAALQSLLDHKLAMHVDAPPPGLSDGALAHFESLRRFFSTSGQCGWSSIRELKEAHLVVAHGNPLAIALLSDLIYMGVGRLTLVGHARVDLRDIQCSTYLLPEDEGRPWSEVVKARFPVARLGTQIDAVDEMPVDSATWEHILSTATLAVAAVGGSTFFHPWIKALNRAALALGRNWIIAGDVHGFGVTVGPAMNSVDTGCLHCFEVRMKNNLQNLDVFSRLEQHVTSTGMDVDFGSFAPAAQIGAHLCAMEVRDLILENRMAQSVGNLLVVDLETYHIGTHSVLKLPRCPECSNIDLKAKTRAWA